MALNNAPDKHWTGRIRLATQTDNDGVVKDGGLILPSLTTTQRDAIVGPEEGQLIFNTTTNKLNFYTGSAWEAVTSS